MDLDWWHRPIEPVVELQPKRQPGRADRKAARYVLEIARLRGAGYSYEAIREALAEVGIELSTSALRREVRRLRMSTHGVSSGVPSAPRPGPRMPADVAPPAASAPPPRPAAPDGGSSHEIAEAFFNAHPSNPLLRTRETR